MSKLSIVKSSLAALVRAKTQVQFGDLVRNRPVSTAFGLDRGTPIDRYYINAFISANAGAIIGRSLEVGELKYLTAYGNRALEKSILVPAAEIAKEHRDSSRIVVCDLNGSAGSAAGQFDCFICTQTLQFIYDVKAAIQCSFDLLAPNGVFLGTVPGISQISQYDMERWGDYWRFTTLSMNRLLKEIFGDRVVVESFGNVLAAQAFLMGLATEDLPHQSLLDNVDSNYQVIIAFRATKS